MVDENREYPWTEESGRLQSMGSQSRTWLSNTAHMWWYSTYSLFNPWESTYELDFIDEDAEAQKA